MLLEQESLKMLRRAMGEEMFSLFNLEGVTEIMANSDGSVFVERGSKTHLVRIHMSEDARLDVISVIAGLMRQQADEKHPRISGKIPVLGHRFQGNLPRMVESPTFTIRKHSPVLLSLETLKEKGCISDEHYSQVVRALRKHKNIIVAGSTGSGKTTFCNACLIAIGPMGERLITIEEDRVSELRVENANKVALYTDRENGVSAADCLVDSLRMNPDRIIFGEVRDEAALDLLEAWNTGHEGGLCTVHANSARDALQRLASLARRANRPPAQPLQFVMSYVDMVIFLKKLPNGTRAVTEVLEVKTCQI